MNDQFSVALKAYVGLGRSPFPNPSQEAVIEAVGCENSSVLLPQVEAIFRELRLLTPDWNAHSLVSATEWAKTEMKLRHPDLGPDSLAVLGWAFTYDWK